MTSHNPKSEVLRGPERRRRRTAAEKLALIAETMEPGMTVSLVARRRYAQQCRVEGLLTKKSEARRQAGGCRPFHDHLRDEQAAEMLGYSGGPQGWSATDPVVQMTRHCGNGCFNWLPSSASSATGVSMCCCAMKGTR
jgi:hypothetical protein